ncbi:hexapeptide transferase [Erysipelothrix sp. HDW6C]|uniref:sugar-transfer associated ATP-grasp domain-containing protein n=1 Tax=Erysipelothrix sp. HDW6C TaxID=2714930 RepID=UPI00140B741E|nr:sugar-transfer associated ATP-grasp domain-containing protein [Erysipelothrix sp. HDW6C]QIK69895.1 hexapeptide transferase [Erysipelothrix sp. HDW6C]
MKKFIWRIKYYFKRLFAMDRQGFKDAIQYAHDHSGKSKIVIFFDMIWCSFRYTAGYVDYNEFEYYLLNGEQRKTFITLGQSDKAVRAYNDREYVNIFDDKSIFVKRFSKFVHRDHLDLLETDAAGLKAFVEKHGKVMAKRTNDYVGRGIDKIDINENPDIDFDQLYKDLVANRQYLIEEFFKQHPKMSELSPTSVNTMRIITFLDDTQTPRVLVTALKSGLGGHVDNIGQGGMYTILDESGTVVYPFIDKHGDHHTNHPLTGENLMGFQIPNFDRLIEQVKEACLVVPQVRYIGWDVAVAESGDAELIEGNSSSGPFQVIPSLSKDKMGVLPIYKKYMNIKF